MWDSSSEVGPDGVKQIAGCKVILSTGQGHCKKSVVWICPGISSL